MDYAKTIEEFLEKVNDFTRTTIELTKLRILDRLTSVLSSVVPQILVFVLIISFGLFLNLGIALWLGEILDHIYLGFFLVAAFYALLAVVLHVFFRKPIKRLVSDYIIRQLFK